MCREGKTSQSLSGVTRSPGLPAGPAIARVELRLARDQLAFGRESVAGGCWTPGRLHIGVDLRVVAGARNAGAKRRHVEVEVGGRAADERRAQPGGVADERHPQFPELALVGGAAHGAGGWHRLRVEVERGVATHEPKRARVDIGLLNLLERGSGKPVAVGAFAGR